jgi:integrase
VVQHWLGDLLKRVSTAANLSQTYTNHCVRATVVTKLHESGLPTADIRAITGHKNDQSIERYKRIQTENSMLAASQALAKNMRVDHSAVSPAPETSTKP